CPQIDVRVKLLDSRIVPLSDPAGKDHRERVTIEHKFARFDPINVDYGNHAANDYRILQQLPFIEFLPIERHVSRPKGHGIGPELLQRGCRTYSLIVELDAGLAPVLSSPFRINRMRER